jgi:hypothetical protein
MHQVRKTAIQGVMHQVRKTAKCAIRGQREENDSFRVCATAKGAIRGQGVERWQLCLQNAPSGRF